MSDGIDRLKAALAMSRRGPWTDLPSTFIGNVRGLDLGEALATIDRLKAEVATLEGLLADAASLDSTDTPRVWQLERRVRELEEALRPFAEWGDRLDHLWEGELLPDDRNLAVGHSNMRLPGDVSMSDLRRAAKVLEGRT